MLRDFFLIVDSFKNTLCPTIMEVYKLAMLEAKKKHFKG